MPKVRLMFINHWNTIFYHNQKRSYETGDQLNQSLEAEESDLKIKPLYDFFNPRFIGYKASYMFWLEMSGVYRGSSSLVQDMFQELSTSQIDRVDKFLKNIYIDDKQKYLEIMPKGKEPFQKGTYSNKILFSNQLAASMVARPELDSISGDFELFAKSLEGNRKVQRVNLQKVRNASVELEKKRVILADGLFYVYGGLVMIHFEKPEEIGKYYEINQMFAKKAGEVIANPDVTVVSLEPLETKEAGMNFVPTDVMSASCVGNSDVEYWITDGTPPNANTKKGIIHSGEECLIKPPEWATSDCRYLYFKCLDNEFNAIVHLVKVNPVP